MKRTLEIRVHDTFEVGGRASTHEAIIPALKIENLAFRGEISALIFESIFSVGMLSLPPTMESAREFQYE